MTLGALAGITVLDLSRLLPGPWCTMMLADHGARVISIDAPHHASGGIFPDLVNRNKEHISLNLKSDKGKDIFLSLARRADVVVEGFRPGVTDRLGVGYSQVQAINPGIVYCSITGFGQTGPCSHTPGHDINYLSEAGALSLMGPANGPPTIPGYQVADIAGGSMGAVSGILLALFYRERTGQGQYIDISISDGTLSLMHLALNIQQNTGQKAARSNTLLSHRYAFYNTYATRDKKYLALGTLEPKCWSAFCRLTGLERYEALQFDEIKRGEIIAAVAATIQEKSLLEWVARFAGHDICWSPVKSLDEAMESELFHAREMVVESKNCRGETIQTIGIPIKLSKTPGSVRSAPSPFGKETEQILATLGFDTAEIITLRDEGVI